MHAAPRRDSDGTRAAGRRVRRAVCRQARTEETPAGSRAGARRDDAASASRHRRRRAARAGCPGRGSSWQHRRDAAWIRQPVRDGPRLRRGRLSGASERRARDVGPGRQRSARGRAAVRRRGQRGVRPRSHRRGDRRDVSNSRSSRRRAIARCGTRSHRRAPARRS